MNQVELKARIAKLEKQVEELEVIQQYSQNEIERMEKDRLIQYELLTEQGKQPYSTSIRAVWGKQFEDALGRAHAARNEKWDIQHELIVLNSQTEEAQAKREEFQREHEREFKRCMREKAVTSETWERTKKRRHREFEARFNQ